MLLLVVGGCDAQGIAVPTETHLPLLAKVLQFDRAFKPKNGKMVVLGVIFQKSWRSSAQVFDEVLSVSGHPSFTVCGLPVEVVPIDASDGLEVRDLLEKGGVDIVYVAPVRGVAIEDIRSASESYHCRTITGVPEFVDGGIALGIDLRNDRPQIVINITASKACGADLSAQVLRLARVVE